MTEKTLLHETERMSKRQDIHEKTATLIWS